MSGDNRLVRYGFYAAAAYNIAGILLVSRGFTNTVLHEIDSLFSVGGCIGICLWGLAYLAMSNSYARAPWVVGVFALEKLFYAGWWARWLVLHGAELPEIAARDAQAASFYGTYGAGDAAFMVFFAWVFWRHRASSLEG